MAAHGHQTVRFSFDQLLEPVRLIAQLAATIALAQAGRGHPMAPAGAIGSATA